MFIPQLLLYKDLQTRNQLQSWFPEPAGLVSQNSPKVDITEKNSAVIKDKLQIKS